MKNIQLPQLLLLVFTLLLFTSCTPHHTTHYDEPIPDFMTITGTITEKIQDGTDGSVYLLKAEDANTYEVLLSIPNLGETYSQYLADVDIGTNIQVSGSTLKLNRYVRIVAKTLALA